MLSLARGVPAVKRGQIQPQAFHTSTIWPIFKGLALNMDSGDTDAGPAGFTVGNQDGGGHRMTALAQYRRLEAIGLWRRAPQTEPREVVVSFGQATLVLSDPGDETPLTHWSLPAIINLTPGRHPAVYTPGTTGPDGQPDETLTISEPDMIDAIARVHRAIETAQAHPGRLRRRLLLGGLVLLIAAAIWWLPGQIIRYSTAVAPPAQRTLVGEAILAQIEQITGPACHRVAGDTVLARLSERLAPAMAAAVADGDSGMGGNDAGTIPSLHVLRGGIQGAIALPGGIILIGPDLLGQKPQADALPPTETGPEPDYSNLTSDRPSPRPADHIQPPAAASADTSPEALAGAILAAMQSAAEADPLAAALGHAGAGSSLRLLIRGRPDGLGLRGHAMKLLLDPPDPPRNGAALLSRFGAVSLPAAPYANRLGLADPLALSLLEGDPMRGQNAPRPILSGSEWRALQEICDPR